MEFIMPIPVLIHRLVPRLAGLKNKSAAVRIYPRRLAVEQTALFSFEQAAQKGSSMVGEISF